MSSKREILVDRMHNDPIFHSLTFTFIAFFEQPDAPSLSDITDAAILALQIKQQRDLHRAMFTPTRMPLGIDGKPQNPYAHDKAARDVRDQGALERKPPR